MFGKILSGGAAVLLAGTATWGVLEKGADIWEFAEKTKALYSLDGQIKKLQDGQKLAVGPEGPRGPAGNAGRQGDTGPQGERGPQGQPGITPAQLADLEKRIAELQQKVAALEKRPVVAGQAPSIARSQTQVASADPADASGATRGSMRRHENGCMFFVPNSSPVTITLSEGDKLCGVDGKSVPTGAPLRVESIADDKVMFGSYASCPRNMECISPWTGGVMAKFVKVDFVGAKPVAVFQLKMRD